LVQTILATKKRIVRALFSISCGTAFACGDGSPANESEATDDDTPSDESEGESTAPETSDEASSDIDDTGDTSSEDDSEQSSETSESSESGESTASSDDESSESESGDDDATPQELPPVTGTCPRFDAGENEFSPSGLTKARTVEIWRSNAANDKDGPLIIYWHGTNSSPIEVQAGLGQAVIDEVLAQGGIIAAPTADPDAGTFPWFLVSGTREDDMVLADEIVACAREKVGIDTAHIHTLGMSAGGLNASQMSFRRSTYLASSVIYSGGLAATTPPNQDPSNHFASMIFHGGESDMVVIGFKEASERYQKALTDAGNFSFICDHGEGHTIPRDANASVLRFFEDHPYHTDPEPYEEELPADFPSYCALP
jgi:poly(3-hydroxybutyrate) depolymerase